MSARNEIRIKDFGVLRPVLEEVYHPKMIDLLAWWHEQYSDMVITSMYRPGKSGVHGTRPCRGIDLRSFHLSDATISEIKADVNAAWEYDSKRPRYSVCGHHNSGSGPHFHLKVHDNTRLRPEIKILKA